jgi:GTP cyclohydrolase I
MYSVDKRANRSHNGQHNGHPQILNYEESRMDLKLKSQDFLEMFELNLPDVDTSRIEAATAEILEAVGEDPQREGLLKTPERVARAYEELLSGYRVDPSKLINGAVFNVEYDDMVIVRDIEFYSLCEHHMLPFIGRAHVAYISSGKVIGLSKIPRIVDMFARRLQVQERMTHQIAEFINEVLEPQGVAVVLEGVHMCSMMRGVKKHDSSMTTSAMLGTFRDDSKTRAEFLAHISRNSHQGGFGL